MAVMTINFTMKTWKYFWDTQDLADHWDEANAAEFEVNIQSEVY